MATTPEPPVFTGFVDTTVDALRVVNAARSGVIPRTIRRLYNTERFSMIKSGAVFVYAVKESGIQRWTDGFVWSPSRISGNFLVYQELNGESSGRRTRGRQPYPAERPPSRSMTQKSSSGHASTTSTSFVAEDQRALKPGGLCKKTITVVINGLEYHLICYHTLDDINSGKLTRPSSNANIMRLPLPPHIFRQSNFRFPPRVVTGIDGEPKFFEIKYVNPVDDKVELEDVEHLNTTSPVWSPGGSISAVQRRVDADSLGVSSGTEGGKPITTTVSTLSNSEKVVAQEGYRLSAPNQTSEGGWWIDAGNGPFNRAHHRNHSC